MNIKQLHIKLRSGYTQDNLHRITTKIIDLYKHKQYGSIIRIMNVVSEFTHEREEHYTKAFYKLMMIYHPDRINHYLGEIEKHYAANDTEQLLRFSHIFPVIDLERTLAVHAEPERPFAPSEEFDDERWDAEAAEAEFEGMYDDEEEDFYRGVEEGSEQRTFYSVFRRIIYGNERIPMPTHYLQDIDIIELSGYEITDLDGIRYCEQLMVLDLSNNSIIDISELSYLPQLTELYLANNQVSFVDALGYMRHLRIADLAYNDIDDVSPLFDLEYLEFVNLVGNPVPAHQLGVLESKGIMIIH